MKEARILNNLGIKRTNSVDQDIYLGHIKHCNLIPRTICRKGSFHGKIKVFALCVTKVSENMADESVDSKGRRTLVDVLSEMS